MKKILKWIFLIIIIGFLTLLGIKLYVNFYSNGKILNINDTSNLKNYDYIIVPGAKIKGENSLSLHLQHRLDCSIRLYNENISPKIIISGGVDEETNIHETLAMKNYLLENNINEEDIIIDEYGLSTYDTLKRVYEYDKTGKNILCTQGMYASRTYFIAKNIGLDIAVINSDIMTYPYNPSLEIREFLTPTKAFINVYILKPEPKYTVAEKPFITK